MYGKPGFTCTVVIVVWARSVETKSARPWQYRIVTISAGQRRPQPAIRLVVSD